MDEKKRQKKLQKKKQKDKQRHANIVKSNLLLQQSSNPKTIIANARLLPVHECLISSDWQERGLAQILITREQPNGNLIFGVYLVDLLCLGLKNTFCNCNYSPGEYMEFRSRFVKEQGLVDCLPALACQIIYGAIDYAADLGFQPQRDFKLSRYILEERTASDIQYHIEYGKNGKPLYIAGPDDNVELILRQLEQKLGRDHFDFIAGLGE